MEKNKRIDSDLGPLLAGHYGLQISRTLSQGRQDTSSPLGLLVGPQICTIAPEVALELGIGVVLTAQEALIHRKCLP